MQLNRKMALMALVALVVTKFKTLVGQAKALRYVENQLLLLTKVVRNILRRYALNYVGRYLS